jgi:hypothetical protein
MHTMMCELSGIDRQPGIFIKGYLRGLLRNQCVKHINFSSSSGRYDFVWFRNFYQLLICNRYFLDRNEGAGSEAECLIQKLAGWNCAEI